MNKSFLLTLNKREEKVVKSKESCYFLIKKILRLKSKTLKKLLQMPIESHQVLLAS